MSFNYLYERKLNRNTIIDFQLGYCTPNGNLEFEASLNDTETQQLILCMLDYSKQYIKSEFKDCILFPIKDLYGEIIAVSGKSLNSNHSRYYNSIYPKGQHLYGLYHIYKYILEKDEVIIVEGNFDLLTLYQNGIKNVVALLGSYLTFNQLCLLLRFTRNIVLAFDNDDSGIKSQMKTERLLKDKNINYSIVTLPFNYDPDQYVREFGKDKFLQLRKTDVYRNF